MAISKIIYKSSASATPETWMDATPATATAEDIASSKTAMLANGVMTTGTGSGGAATKGDVNFIDYDGTLIASKTKAEIDAMTSDSDLPANPTHTGLTAQGWNWTVAQLKAQLTAMPDQVVWVGQLYITESGATEIDVVMQEGRLSPIMTICVNGEVSIDWGDNTTPNTVTGTSVSTRLEVPHTYASAGSYTIKISSVSGTYSFYGDSPYTLLRKNTTMNQNRVYANCIQHIRLGGGITSIGTYAFYSCYSLASVTIPSSVTSIETHAFDTCYSLASITIPSGVTSIADGAFYYCYSLASITIPSGITSIGGSTFYNCISLTSVTIPSGVTSIVSYVFYGCNSLASITIPSGVTSIGDYAFYNCYSLASVTIPDSVTSIMSNVFNGCYSLTSITIPSGVTSIGSSAFYGCLSLVSVTIPSGITSIGSSVFRNCSSLANVTIPSGVTSIGTYAFYGCYALSSITIPSGVTSIGTNAFNGCNSLASIAIPSGVTSIGSSTFNDCYSLASITIPSKVTSVGSNSFYNCYGMAEYHFQRTAPPTLSNKNAFTSIPSDCIIYVPRSGDQAVLNSYKTASNWSNYASYMREEPAS